jgi:hypothetical protein
MSLPPAPELAACLEVLYRATIEARMLGYEGHAHGLSPQQSDQLAALMDAVHNIPHLVLDWEQCNESLLVGLLRDYDERWGGGLHHSYERVISERS